MVAKIENKVSNASKRFYKLLEPGQIGNVKIKNRMFKTAAGSTLGDGSGMVTQKHKAFYGALARGGLGLIFVEHCSIEPEVQNISTGGGTFLHLNEDKYIPSLKGLTDLIHKYNCKAFVQLQAGGATTSRPDGHPVSSSPLTIEEMRERQPYHKVYLLENPQIPRALTITEIKEMEELFAAAAERAARAGFEGVELNGGNGHLINAFVSRIWNRRQDEYGCQSIENRARFLVEIIQAVKKRMGKDFVTTVNFNAAEYGLPDCTTLEEGVEFAKIFEKAGADAILGRSHGYKDVTMDMIWPERLFVGEPPQPLPKDCDWSHYGAGAIIPIAAALKKVVSVPVLVSGRIDPVIGERALEQGKADFIGMTRRLQADPELPNKLAEGRPEDIAPCTACSHCLENNALRRPLICRMNPAIGGEKEYIIEPLKSGAKKKKIVVVGGGPAAMEAARIAALRGHEVILYEKSNKLGGLMTLAALVKGTEIEDLPEMTRYLEHQIRKLGVKVNLGKEFTPSMADELKPDVVILATGGIAEVPPIPGINRRNVVSNEKLHHQLKFFLRFIGPETLRNLTRYWMPLGKRVIIIGGAIQGIELAEFLVKRGRQVTVVEQSEQLGELMPIRNWIKMSKWLPKKGAVLISGVKKYVEITDKGLTIIDKDGKERTLEADTIATALPLKANNELLNALKGKVPEVYAIGDCKEPRLILNAVADGYRVAQEV
jgi:2,4-dienoyl-CoA reductase (NADPH2)